MLRYGVVLCFMMLSFLAFYGVVFYGVVFYGVLWCFMVCCVVLCCVVFCGVLWCVLWCFMVCCVVLCFMVLRCAALRYIILYYFNKHRKKLTCISNQIFRFRLKLFKDVKNAIKFKNVENIQRLKKCVFEVCLQILLTQCSLKLTFQVHINANDNFCYTRTRHHLQ